MHRTDAPWSWGGVIKYDRSIPNSCLGHLPVVHVSSCLVCGVGANDTGAYSSLVDAIRYDASILDSLYKNDPTAQTYRSGYQREPLVTSVGSLYRVFSLLPFWLRNTSRVISQI